MATLWGSNGGALLACLSAEGLADRLGILPFACFAVGLVLSIATGLVNLLYGSRSLEPISELKNMFVVGSTMGEFDPEQVQPLIDRIQRSTVFKWPLWACGIGSLILFIAGAILSATRVLT
jgi:hypothetical protein